MKAHLAYLRYIARHKWFVFLAGRRLRVSLWRLIIHDWSKFSPAEWGPYVHNFYNPDGSKKQVRDATGRYEPINQESLPFRLAWLHHQRMNLHHWQPWVLIGDDGKWEAMPIPDKYLREMIADWEGAGRAIIGRLDPRPWYEQNKDVILLEPKTRARLEVLMAVRYGNKET